MAEYLTGPERVLIGHLAEGNTFAVAVKLAGIDADRGWELARRFGFPHASWRDLNVRIAKGERIEVPPSPTGVAVCEACEHLAVDCVCEAPAPGATLAVAPGPVAPEGTTRCGGCEGVVGVDCVCDVLEEAAHRPVGAGLGQLVAELAAKGAVPEQRGVIEPAAERIRRFGVELAEAEQQATADRIRAGYTATWRIPSPEVVWSPDGQVPAAETVLTVIVDPTLLAEAVAAELPARALKVGARTELTDAGVAALDRLLQLRDGEL